MPVSAEMTGCSTSRTEARPAGNSYGTSINNWWLGSVII
jgi:hypothetical protein